MSDIVQETFEIFKRNLELKDSWGNNPYMPKEKFEALLKEVQAHVSKSFELGERHGQILALSRISNATAEFFDEHKTKYEIKESEIQAASRYQMWLDEWLLKR